MNAVEVQLRPDDIRVLVGAAGGTRHRPDDRDLLQVLRGLLALTVCFVAVEYSVAWIAVAILLAILAVEAHVHRTYRRQRALELLNGTYTIVTEGVQRRNVAAEMLVRWAAIERVTQTSDHFLIHYSGAVWILPFRCFPSPADRDDFARVLLARSPIG